VPTHAENREAISTRGPDTTSRTVLNNSVAAESIGVEGVAMTRA